MIDKLMNSFVLIVPQADIRAPLHELDYAFFSLAVQRDSTTFLHQGVHQSQPGLRSVEIRLKSNLIDEHDSDETVEA